MKNRSHLDAAMIHVGADWLFGVDIRDFFRSTPKDLVQTYLEQLGYPKSGARLLADLTCLNGFLAQGAPSSPVLSNLCISDIDRHLQGIAGKHQIRLTRYADDIVFSGMDEIPDSLRSEVENLFLSSPWQLAPEKIELWVRPHRLKVHGILVDGPSPRLTKGYRNKLRAFHHILKRTDLNGADRARLAGHVNYSNYVERVVGLYLRKHQALNLDDMF